MLKELKVYKASLDPPDQLEMLVLLDQPVRPENGEFKVFKASLDQPDQQENREFRVSLDPQDPLVILEHKEIWARLGLQVIQAP